LKQHELKNALSTEKDEKMLVEMFGEENKEKLLEHGNLNLIDSLCNTKEDVDATKVFEMVKRIRLVFVVDMPKR